MIIRSFVSSKYSLFLILGLFISLPAFGQEVEEKGRFSGSFQATANWFIKDSAIGAANTPQYEDKKYGGEAWLNVNYTKGTLDMGVRFDMFNNSNLLNPTGAFTAQGIGAWWVHKKLGKINLSGGYIYDQIGSGIIYRAFEDRPLAIDNALYGVRVGYDINPDWNIKVFAGKVKNQLNLFNPIMKGGQLNGFIKGKEGSDFSMAPGIGFVNQTLDDETIQNIVASVATYLPSEGIQLYNNNYAYSVFNTLTWKGVTLYTEGAYKWHDVYRDPFAKLNLWSGEKTIGRFVDKAGTCFLGSLSWSWSKFGISLETKRTENFRYRSDPFATGNLAFLNFIPPMARQNTYRLTAFYSPVTQELSEQAFQGEITYALKKNIGLLINGSYIDDLKGDPLYREIFTEVTIKKAKKYNIVTGIQYQRYNIDIYLTKPGEPDVNTITPYFDVLWKIDKKKSLRVEGQFMFTEQDRGNWAFALVEYGIAPKWFFTVSDMLNLASDNVLLKRPDLKSLGHFLSGGITYTEKSNRFALNFVKQVDGIVCSGGVCRYEPAFSGVRFNILSNF